MRYSIVLACHLFLTLSSEAYATVVRHAPLRELTQASTWVIHATVGAVDDDLSTDASGPFLTRVNFNIIEVLRGPQADRSKLSVVFPGGRSGERIARIPGMPQFKMGEEVVVLLESTGEGRFIPIGLEQGVFRIENKNGERTVHRNMGSLHFVKDPHGEEKPFEDVMPKSIAQLLSTLRQFAKEGARQ